MIALQKPFGKNVRMEPSDTRQVALALEQTGHCERPVKGQEPMFWMPEDTLMDGLRRFQSEQGLRPDGLIMPGGPTETAINTALMSEGQREGGAQRLEWDVAPEVDDAPSAPFATEPPEDTLGQEPQGRLSVSPVKTSLPLNGPEKGDYEAFRKEIYRLSDHDLFARTQWEDTNECVLLVKRFRPDLGYAGGWRQGPSIGAVGDIRPGDAFASGFVNGKYTNKSTGNHAILIVDVHRDENGRVVAVDYADQFAKRTGAHKREAQPVKIHTSIPVSDLAGKGYFTIQGGGK